MTPELPGPRLLASTGPLLMSSLSWTLDAIADAGYEAAEVMVAHNAETRDATTVLDYAAEAGLEIPVVHGPYLLLLRTVFGANYVEKTRRTFELCAELGATTMVAHAPFRWERTARGWVTAEAEAEAAAAGTTFAMENLFPVAGRSFSSVITPDELTPFSHVVFDTSHFAVAGIDLFEAWAALSDCVSHLHVSDNLGTGKDSHAPIGTGVLPLQQFLGHVGASGWGGTITLELDCRRYLETRDGLVEFLARERVKAEALLAGEDVEDVEELSPV